MIMNWPSLLENGTKNAKAMDLIPVQPILWREDPSNSDYSVIFFQGCSTKQGALAKCNLKFVSHSSSFQEMWISEFSSFEKWFSQITGFMVKI